MNNKRKRSSKTSAPQCLCLGAGPVLSDLLRRLRPPEGARKHFETARLELLKGIRAILDARIEQVSKRNRKGEKIEVE